MMSSSDKKTFYIYYCDQFDRRKTKIIIGVVSQLIVKEKPEVLYFLLSSNGGEVDAGITLYNFLKSLSLEIIMHNIGSIDSVANIVFMAGEKRYANPHTTFLYHGTSMRTNTPVTLSLQQIKEIKDRLDKDHKRIAGILCENTKLKEEEIKKLFLEGETKDVEFALEKGIINKVKLAKVPKQGLFVSININD